MPSLKMKMKSSTDSPRENNGLHVCQKSSKISKNSFSHARNFQHEAELDTFTTNKHDDSFCNKATCQETRSDETSCCEMVDEEILQLQKHISPSSNLGPVCRMDHTQANCPSTIETIFSPILDSIDIDIEPNCNVSDFFFSDTISISEATCLLDYEYDESSRFSVEEYMLLPFLEDSIETTSQYEDNLINSESIILSEESNIYLAIHQESDINDFPDWDPTEFLDPQIFIRNFLDLSEMSTLLPQESRERKSVTLVLDLDETLVHSSLEQCDDADFTFPVISSLKEHTVYVKQRPYLRAFLEKVSEMFDIVVFTASQSIYAKQLLDILDQDGKIISRRAYRESCIFIDGSYTKDLTVLGVDLAKIVIIDNSPQVFRLQVNNGIPIKSWFDDPSDCALITLLPFLETLVDAEDVRPIIAKRFGNKE